MKHFDVKSLLAFFSIVLIWYGELRLRAVMFGHVVKSIFDRPHTVIAIALLLAIAYWARKTQRLIVFDIASIVIASILFSLL